MSAAVAWSLNAAIRLPAAVSTSVAVAKTRPPCRNPMAIGWTPGTVTAPYVIWPPATYAGCPSGSTAIRVTPVGATTVAVPCTVQDWSTPPGPITNRWLPSGDQRKPPPSGASTCGLSSAPGLLVGWLVGTDDGDGDGAMVTNETLAGLARPWWVLVWADGWTVTSYCVFGASACTGVIVSRVLSSCQL